MSSVCKMCLSRHCGDLVLIFKTEIECENIKLSIKITNSFNVTVKWYTVGVLVYIMVYC